MRKSGEQPLIALDAGALLFPAEQVAAGDAEQLKATAMGIVEAYNLMRFDAVGIAPHDLAGGLAFLETLRDKATFPWLSANLISAQSRKPVFRQSTTVKAGNLVIGVIGLTGDTVPPANLEGKIAVLPWAEALPPVVTALAKQTDIIVLLSSYALEQNKKIAELFPQVHLILQSGSSTKRLEPQLSANTLVTQTDLKGKSIGVLEIFWQSSKKWGSDPQEALSEKKSEEDRLRWQLKRYRSKGEPEVVYKDNQKILEAYKELLQKHEDILAQIAALEEGIKGNQAGGISPSTFKSRFIAMETSLPDHPGVEKIVQATNEAVNEIGKKKMQAPGGKNATASIPRPVFAEYRGWQSCASCHPKETEAWQKTRHAKAYTTLADKGQQFNFKCVPCHVTGMVSGETQEYSSLPQDFLAVGCESCHGPGKKHLENQQNTMAAAPPVEICLGCHSEDQDDDFDYNRDKLLVH